MKTKITLSSIVPLILVLLHVGILQAQQRIAALQEPFVILIDPADGSIVDPQFIDLTAQNQGLPKAIIQVNDELWISDQTEDQIYRYDLSGTFLSTINGALDNIKGMALINNSEVWVTNAGSNNGAPGNAIVRFDTDGNNVGFITTNGSSFDIIDTGAEVYISYINTETRIERRDYAGAILGDIVGQGVVSFMQQMEVNTTNNSIFTGVFSTNTPNGPGLYEFSITDGSILDYYDIGALRGVAQLDDGNILFSSGNNLNLLNTTTGGTSLVSAGGSTQFFASVDLMPCTVPATPTGDAAQTFNEGATLADIVVNPTDVSWFATETDAMNNTNPLANTTVLVDGETYYAISIDGACLSDFLAVTVTVLCNPPAAPTGDAMQSFSEGATLADVVVSPAGVSWYATEADALATMNELPLTTVLVDGEDYFAVNIVNDCPSTPFEVTIEILLNVDDFNQSQIKLFPNPVNDSFTVSHSVKINQVSVRNLLGQLVLKKVATSNEVTLDTSSLTTGIYLVTIVAENQKQTIKIVKE